MMRKVDTKKRELYDWINSISFAVYETLLFLDTHPDDMEALAFFEECSKMRNEAMDEFAKLYGPLLIDDVTISDADYWNWINQPWPWELGGY